MSVSGTVYLWFSWFLPITLLNELIKIKLKQIKVVENGFGKGTEMMALLEIEM